MKSFDKEKMKAELHRRVSKVQRDVEVNFNLTDNKDINRITRKVKSVTTK